jgi:hypothetical protein
MTEQVKLEVAAQMLGVRVEVATFALLMEKRLAEGSGWKQSTAEDLKYGPEMAGLYVRRSIEEKSSAEVLTKKAIDVACFAMMIADVVGGLK